MLLYLFCNLHKLHPIDDLLESKSRNKNKKKIYQTLALCAETNDSPLVVYSLEFLVETVVYMSIDDINYDHLQYDANKRMMNNLHIPNHWLQPIANHMFRVIEIAMMHHLLHNHRMECQHFPIQWFDQMMSEMIDAILA